MSDTGVYTCIASNRAGESELDFSLQVQCEPNRSSNWDDLECREWDYLNPKPSSNKTIQIPTNSTRTDALLTSDDLDIVPTNGDNNEGTRSLRTSRRHYPVRSKKMLHTDTVKPWKHVTHRKKMTAKRKFDIQWLWSTSRDRHPWNP